MYVLSAYVYDLCDKGYDLFPTYYKGATQCRCRNANLHSSRLTSLRTVELDCLSTY